MGKSYAIRGEVVKNDLYHTPKSLIPMLIEKEKFKKIWEPACGQMAIAEPLRELDLDVITSDIANGTNFLTCELGSGKRDIITNPPFFIWDDFVKRAKDLNIRKFAFIGRLNYLGTASRYNEGIFEGLKAIYPFNRYIDYQTPLRDDGLFHVGAMATAWMVWERKYKGSAKMEQLEVNPWAKLGNYDPWAYKIYQHLGIQFTWTPDMKFDTKDLLFRLEESLNFKFTQKEINSNCNKISDVIRLLKKVNKERTFENLDSWSRV